MNRQRVTFEFHGGPRDGERFLMLIRPSEVLGLLPNRVEVDASPEGLYELRLADHVYRWRYKRRYPRA